MKVPTWKEKQSILYHTKNNVSSEKLIAYGDACVENGYIQDAIEYFKKADHKLGLNKIAQTAANEGDYFTLKQCFSAIKPQDQASLTATCLKQAQELGKNIFAEQITHAPDSHA